ncbi:hypothetical protein BDZ97DRAFT_718075 [Flammula alnicola]|nr:hypothetical protein BDZ97DRAFT_718075 [Flammula alnicola]
MFAFFHNMGSFCPSRIGVVWNDAKQTALIGSIFSNYYVPPIVFTVVRKSDGSEMRICIDGKQRLTSMYRFLKGEIAHKDATSNRKSYFVSPTGAKRKLITPQMQANFRNKQITCVEYEDLTGEQEREIFQRVQLGVALAPADRLPAINGPYANLVRNVRRRIETTQGFELYLDWGKARGKDFQALAQIVYLIAYGHQPRKAEPTSMRLEAFLSNQSPEAGFHTLQENANNVMDIFCRIAQHWDLGKPLKKLLSPMEFVMSSYLVFLQRKKLSDTQLSDAMAHMRRDFKSACPDLKCNQKNFKHILSFVQKEVPKLAPRLRRGPPEERSSFEVPIQRVEVAPRKKEADQSSESCFSVKVVGKRKRAKAEEEESQCSDDAYIAPVKKKAKAKLKPESKTPTLDQAGTSAVATETKPKSRVAPSARSAKTVVKKSPAKNKAGPPSTAKASISTSASAPASASASIGKTKTIQPQVGKPSVRPPPSARTASASTIGKVASLSNVPRVVSAPSAPSPLPVPGSMPSRPLARPPLPGRSHTPLPASASASPIVPDATLLNVPQEVRNTSQVASRTDSSYAPTARPSTTTGGSDGGPDRLGPLRNAKAALAAANQTNGCASKLASASTLTIGSSSSVQGSSSWIGTSTATGERKPLPKFTKTSALASEPAVSPADVDAKWQADVGGLLNAVGGGNGKQPPLGPRKFMEGRPPSRSTPMVSAQVLAPSTAANVRPGGSSSSSTPTPSPSIPPHVPGQLRPAVAALGRPM